MFDAARAARGHALVLEAKVHGQRTALSLDAVHERAARMAHALRARGLRPGDRVVVHLANCVEYVDLLLACLRSGIILVPANVLYRGRELGHIVSDAEPTLVVTSAEHVGLFGSDRRAITIDTLGGEAAALAHAAGTRGADIAGAGDAPAPAAVPAPTDDAPALIIYTSGTTGRAKGAVLSHGNVAANVRHLVDAWRIGASDRYLAVLPLFHVHGLCNGLCCWLATGCLMRLEERFDHAAAPAWFAEFRPTLFYGVPTVYTRMLEWPAETPVDGVRGARLFVSGSAPLPAQVHEAFRTRFGHTILERYGMSETLMNTGNPYDGERRAGTVGVPFRDVRVRVVDAAARPVPDGTVGELEVRGPNVFAGYWRNRDATAAAFRDGWFRTGDLAERSADGYYPLRGRASDLIISGGFNIYPREIEEVLLEVPGVREVVVAGMPDERRGEVPVAYLVADPGVTDDALRAACAASIASFKVPRGFVRVDALPRTALGKVQKRLLPPWPGA
jgi:malonyl-CoA/methylmalonyl-CoA synthetase